MVPFTFQIDLMILFCLLSRLYWSYLCLAEIRGLMYDTANIFVNASIMTRNQQACTEEEKSLTEFPGLTLSLLTDY